MNQVRQINELRNFISAFQLDEISLCDRLIEFALIDPNKTQGQVVRDSGEKVIDLSQKHSYDSKLCESPELMRDYFASLQKCLIEYSKQYIYGVTQVNLGVLETANVQRYPAGGGFKVYHFERNTSSFPTVNRYLVFMTYLNDILEGGETEFFYQGLKVKPEKGLTLIWPSDWPFTHRGIPARNEEKFIVTGWLSLVVGV